jgi:hypothetical protein
MWEPLPVRQQFGKIGGTSSCLRIKLAAMFGGGGIAGSRAEESGYPPSPLNLWTHWVSKKFPAKSACQRTYILKSVKHRT